MKDYVHLIGSNNIVEFGQIQMALRNAGVDFKSQNETALTAGSVELTGIQGASILVEKSDFNTSRKVLREIGIESSDSSKGLNTFWIVGFLLLAIIILGLMTFMRS